MTTISSRRPPPLRGLAAVLVAAATTRCGAPRGRRLLGLLALVGVPVLTMTIKVVFDQGGRGQGFVGFATIVTRGYLQLIVPLVLIFLGTAAFAEEWAAGTAPYVVGLPVARPALVLGRWLACVGRGLALVLPALLAVYALTTVPLEVFSEYLASLLWVLVVVSVLVAAYAAVFLFFGLALRRAVMTSLVYVFALEVAAANMPQAVASISLGFHARNVLAHLTEPLVGADHFRLITTDLYAVEPPGLFSSLLVLLVLTSAALAGAALVLRHKEAGGEGPGGEAAST